MAVWMIFTIICVIGMGIFSGMAINNYLDHKIDKFKKKIPWILLFLALCTASTLTMINVPNDHIGDGQKVAVVYNNDGTEQGPLYYSERHDEYFTIETSLYNIFDLTEKQVVNKDVALKYIDAYNKLHSIDLEDKG